MYNKRNIRYEASDMKDRIEREVILEYIQLGRGHMAEKKKLAKELGIAFSTMKYRVAKFKAGQGIGRKKRSDAGIPKKDPELKIKLEFFAERALGKNVDETTAKLGLTEHQGNILERQFKQQDRWKALRNAPQLDDLKDLVADIFRLDIATVLMELEGALKFNVKDGNVIIIPLEELNDIKVILAHCMQRQEMAKVDPAYANMKKDEIERVRIYYLKEEMLEKKDSKAFASLHRATKPPATGIKPDLKLMYAIINLFKPGMDEKAKLDLIMNEAKKMKIDG